jgi:hypothetical protein
MLWTIIALLAALWLLGLFGHIGAALPEALIASEERHVA